MVFLTLRYIFCELDGGGGTLALRKYIILKTKHYQNILKYVRHHCYFKLFYFSKSVSFHIYKISIYTKIGILIMYTYYISHYPIKKAQAMLVIFNRKFNMEFVQ